MIKAWPITALHLSGRCKGSNWRPSLGLIYRFWEQVALPLLRQLVPCHMEKAQQESERMRPTGEKKQSKVEKRHGQQRQNPRDINLIVAVPEACFLDFFLHFQVLSQHSPSF